MKTNKNESILWIIAVLENRLFAMPVDNVETMVMLPAVNSVPNTPHHVRGVINIRGRVIPAIDLRIRLGLPTLKEEVTKLGSMLIQREEDHKNWVKELELSLKESREFKLATNHHLCAFGKWYDTYTTENLIVSALLKKFDEPHQRIHAIAHKVISLEKANNRTAAQKLIDETRGGDLATMVQLFASLRTALQESIREIAIVLTVEGNTFAVIVDSIETISHLTIGADDNIQNIGINLTEPGLLTSVGRIEKSGKLVLTLDALSIFGK